VHRRHRHPGTALEQPGELLQRGRPEELRQDHRVNVKKKVRVPFSPRRWVDDSLTRERMVGEEPLRDRSNVQMFKSSRFSSRARSINIIFGEQFNIVEKVKSELGFKVAHREVIEGGGHMRSESKVKLPLQFYR
jgi:hypothetical protein